MKTSRHIPEYALGILCAFCLMIVFLITSVEAVAYWTPGYYEKEYTKYQVLNDLPPMQMQDLLDVTDQMMAFLRGKRDHLHVFTTINGSEREFFNAREIAHMEDVRALFLAALALRRICVGISAACLAGLLLWKKKQSARTLFRSLCLGTAAFFGVVLLLAAVISTDFSKYFVVFHKIFFRNDLWILDPQTDLLINIVPEPFFMDTALRIGLTFAAVSVLFFGINLFLSRRFGGKR